MSSRKYDKETFITIFLLLGILLTLGLLAYFITSGTKNKPDSDQRNQTPTNTQEPPPPPLDDDTLDIRFGGNPSNPKPGSPAYLFLHWPDQPDAGKMLLFQAIQTIGTTVIRMLLDRLYDDGLERKRNQAHRISKANTN